MGATHYKVCLPGVDGGVVVAHKLLMRRQVQEMRNLQPILASIPAQFLEVVLRHTKGLNLVSRVRILGMMLPSWATN